MGAMVTKEELERQWHDWRSGGIGASEAPVIYLGRVFDTTPMKLYIKKRDPSFTFKRDEDSPDFRRGHTYEPLAAQRLALKTGIVVHYPADDAERYGERYCLADPDAPHRRVSLDAICEDGWIAEIKSPRQMSVDRIKVDGIKDYYQVQAAYQAGVANQTGTFAWGPGECKGVRLVIWEPDAADITMIHLPFDAELNEPVLAAVDRFWFDHIVSGEPPFDAPPARIPPAPKNAKYTPVTGDAWREIGEMYALAKDAADASAARLDNAKAIIKEAMGKVEESRILLPNNVKFVLSEQAGRKSYNLDLLRHEHPDIDMERYAQFGNPSTSLRCYGATKANVEAVDLDDQLNGLGAELAAFARASLPVDETELQFEALRGRTELYLRMLRHEQEALNEQLEQAAKAYQRTMFGGEQ